MGDATVAPADPVSSGPGDNPLHVALATALRRPRYEVLPLAGTLDQVEAHVARDIPVTVTASPRRGLEATLTTTEALRRHGYCVVPHLAARLVKSEGQLADVLRRLEDAGVRDVFVVGGDSEQPTGDFPDALTLLTAMQELRRSGVGHQLEQVGITGYPEGHPSISDEELAAALRAKQSLATYVVTQMCFDPKVVSRWVSDVRGMGVHLPIYVGVPGKLDRIKLMNVCGRIGLGESARFLRKHRYGTLRLVLPGAYQPSRLVKGLAGDLVDPDRGVAGLHVYTLGGVAATEHWRRHALARLTGEESRT